LSVTTSKGNVICDVYSQDKDMPYTNNMQLAVLRGYVNQDGGMWCFKGGLPVVVINGSLSKPSITPQ